MANECEYFMISGKEHRLYEKFRKHIEECYKVKIKIPLVASSDSDIVFICIYGEESCRNGVKKFISDEMLNENVQHNGDVDVVTISDSDDDESSSSDKDVSETPSSKSTASSNSLLEEGVLIIDDFVSSSIDTQKKSTEKIERCDVLEDDSIRIIENPKNSQQQNQANPKRKKRRINRMKSKKRVRSNVSLTDAKARNQINNCDENKTESPAGLQHSSDFIPVFDTGKNNFITHHCRQSKIDEGDVILLGSFFVNKDVNSPHGKLPSTQKEKNEGIVKIEKNIATTNSLRPVVIDGSNVAMAHGNHKKFSGKGIQLAINYFLNRGHTRITAFVPRFRQHFNPKHTIPTMNAEIIQDLAKKQLVVFTPPRSYDDRFIVQLAAKTDGVIVSNDEYKDLLTEDESFREVIKKRKIGFCIADKDEFMVPEDPFGRNGPKLAEILSFPPKNAVP